MGTVQTFLLKKIQHQSERALLGIESGGTRTVALLVAEGKQPLQAEFGPANLHLLNDRELVGRFREIRAFHFAAVPTLAGIAIGMAGARTAADRERIRKAAAEVWPQTPCYATNDLETALAAGSSAGDATRVLILSGTGSCCYGQTPKGKTFRFGGWGHILGDKGSAYDIALIALQRVVFDFDVEGRLSPLGRQILRSLQLNEPDALIDWVKGADKTQVAALAVPVFEAAKRDKIAAQVLAEAAEGLAQSGVHCARRLGKNAQIEFILSGGILQKQAQFAKQVGARLLELWPQARVQTLQRESVWGAIELAKKHFGGSAEFCEATPVRQNSAEEIDIPVSLKLSPTEERNPRSLKLDALPLREAIALIASEDAKIPRALLRESAHIERAIGLIVRALKNGGHVFYVGAGSSGRLGALDASEIPPTFRADPEMVQGIIAGGYTALWKSIEGAEDSPSAGVAAIEFRGVTRRDVVVGIAASGRTPFVWGALKAAKARGAATVLLCFNPFLKIAPAIRPTVVIAPNVGPEILTGSTRLKAGTATKMVLNMLTTLSMVRLGKVMGNLMVDLNASNKKLRERAARIVGAITGADAEAAQNALVQSNWIVKDACRRLKKRM